MKQPLSLANYRVYSYQRERTPLPSRRHLQDKKTLKIYDVIQNTLKQIVYSHLQFYLTQNQDKLTTSGPKTICYLFGLRTTESKSSIIKQLTILYVQNRIINRRQPLKHVEQLHLSCWKSHSEFLSKFRMSPPNVRYLCGSACPRTSNQEEFPQFLQVARKICSIDEALRTVRKDLEGFCVRLQQNSQMYASDYRDKQRMQEECQRILKDVKTKVLREIETQFSAMQARISQQISRFDEKIHARYRKIEEVTQRLYEGYQNQLSSLASRQKILKTLIKYHSEHQRVKNEQLLFQLEHSVQQLKQEGVKISINPTLFEMVSKIGGFIMINEFEEILRENRDLPFAVPSYSNGVNFSYGSKSN